MTASDQSGNLYAHELMHILTAHGLELTDLVDQVGLDPATVEHLRLSLTDPLLTPVLSPDEEEFLVKGLLLDATEQRRLLAALIGTAIWRMVKDQLGSTCAHQLNTQTYPFLLAASLKVDLDTLSQLDRAPDHDSLEDQTWQRIWGAIDSAALAFQLSQGRTLSRSGQIGYLREAHTWLEAAMTDLENLNADSKASPIWRTCHNKASKEFKAVIRRLRQLETK